MAEKFVCIYCKKSQPEVEPAASHIFPESLGHGKEYPNVCKTCNGRINQEVEIPVKDGLRELRAFLGIRAKGRKSPRVKVDFSVMGHTKSVWVRDIFGPPDREMKFEKGKQTLLVGPPHRFETAKKTIDQRRTMEWESEGVGVSATQGFTIDLSVLREKCALRLAAKIALETYASLRTLAVILDSEFDDIRNFVLCGQADEPLAFILVDQVVREGLRVPFPCHAVYIDGRCGSRFLVGVVGLFGLIQYEVVLSKRNLGLASYQRQEITFPHSHDTYEPIFRNCDPPSLYSRLHVNQMDRGQAFDIVAPHALAILQSALSLAGERLRTKETDRDEPL